MDFEIHWSPRARNNLKKVVDYLRRAEPRAIDSVLLAIEEKLRLLTTFPFLGSVFERSPLREIRETLAGSYRIFYEVDESIERITLIALCHVRQADPDFEE